MDHATSSIEIGRARGPAELRRASFPLPRRAGQLFTYDELVLVASKP